MDDARADQGGHALACGHGTSQHWYYCHAAAAAVRPSTQRSRGHEHPHHLAVKRTTIIIKKKSEKLFPLLDFE